MELLLTRVYHEAGTNGTLTIAGQVQCFTIELPWKDNASEISCIPEARYQLVKRTSVRFKKHLEVRNVEGRSDILIHCANDALLELRGCIAPVTRHTRPGCGTQSRAAFNALLKRVYEAIDRKEKVFLTIQSLKNQQHEGE